MPTVSFTLEGRDPARIADAVGKQGIYVWNVHNYALAIVERLGLPEEIAKFGEVLENFAG